VFSVYAKTLPGGDNLALVGFALGAYGLTQAFFQIPYGIASDIFGRKLVIVIGLVIFALGSFVAAWAPDMTGSSSAASCRAWARSRRRLPRWPPT
jgi:MFS family permease